MKPARPIVACALLPLLASLASAQEWGRFRGPNGSGVSGSTGLPTEFGSEQNLAWKAELPSSSSSPVLTKDAVYLTATSESKLQVLCLERADGSLRWRRDLERVHDEEMYPANDAASPTPVTDGQNVYAFFQGRGLVSFDGEGEERWNLPLGPFVSFYGMAASPVLAGDTLILLCDQQQGSYLLAVNKDSGEVLWRTERSGMIESWTTPVLHPAEAPRTVVVFGSFFLCGYSLETGAETWRLAGLGYSPVCSPVLGGDRIFASVPNHAEVPLPKWADLIAQADKNADNKLAKDEVAGGPMQDHFGWADADKDGFVDPEEWAFVSAGMNSRDYGLVAVDLVQGEGAATPTERWRHKRSLPSIATPLLYQGVVYLVKDGGILTSIDATTGEVLKSARLADGGGGTFYPSPVAADGKIFLANNEGDVTVLKAGGEWEVLAVNALEQPIKGSPAIAGGSLYLRTEDGLLCFRQEVSR